MKRIAFLLIAVAAVVGLVAFTAPASRHASPQYCSPCGTAHLQGVCAQDVVSWFVI